VLAKKGKSLKHGEDQNHLVGGVKPGVREEKISGEPVWNPKDKHCRLGRKGKGLSEASELLKWKKRTEKKLKERRDGGESIVGHLRCTSAEAVKNAPRANKFVTKDGRL